MQTRLYHHPNRMLRASSHLAVLPCGIVVTPSCSYSVLDAPVHGSVYREVRDYLLNGLRDYGLCDALPSAIYLACGCQHRISHKTEPSLCILVIEFELHKSRAYS